ncbi:MAG: histidine kinase [Phototrophicales bacterium]|nr:MAG: histidine kinase [Phototrophicales bacterium]
MLMLPDFRVRQRDFLLEISRAITSQLDLGEVLRRVLHASVVMLGGQMGLIALRAPDGWFYVRAIRGLDSSLISKLNTHLHDLTTMVKEGADTDAFNEKLAEMATDIDPEVQQSVALPLVFANEPLGMMIVFRTYRSVATANDMQVLQSFADQAAIAVHNAQLYESINHERMRLEAILDQSADGVMILDANLTILRFNRALERMTGRDAKDVIGLHQDEVFEWEKLEQGDLQSAIDDGWPFTLAASDNQGTPLYVEGDLKRPDGLKISIGITYAPMFTTDGKITNIIANVRDITNFREAQEMQNTFISVVSHELKTPVAIIKGYAATLSRPDANWNPDVVRETLHVIEEEADRLTALIQDLLTASKLQAQRELQLDLGEVWLDEVVRRSVERFSTQTNKHQFVIHFPADFPSIQGDETKLRQVIDNLLSNAVKYSPNGGVIEVGGEVTDHLVKIYVSDSGVGLTKEDQGRIFERFYRVDGKLSRKTQGTGLGLYLARAIVEAHGGMIRVDSQPGQGSTFYFTLPRH